MGGTKGEKDRLLASAPSALGEEGPAEQDKKNSLYGDKTKTKKREQKNWKKKAQAAADFRKKKVGALEGRPPPVSKLKKKKVARELGGNGSKWEGGTHGGKNGKKSKSVYS